MANKKRAIIEINGRRYDANTGVLLDAPAVSVKHTSTQVPSSEINKPTIKTDSAVERASHHAKAHTPQRSQTLMRRSVHKPVHGAKSQFRAHSNTLALPGKTAIAVAKKPSALQVEPMRLSRSKSVFKSQLVQRFAPNVLTTEQVALQDNLIIPPDASRVNKPQIVTLDPVAKSASQVVFEKALAHATAHEQQPFNPKKHAREQHRHAKHLKRVARPFYRRTSTLAALSLSLLVIGSVVVLQNRPALTLHFANAKAGFSASLPAFKPAGFGYGSFTYKRGAVGIQFTSDQRDRTFSLQQQTTDWDSQKLLINQVAKKSYSYQALTVAGRTIYIYGQNNASWVDKGVMYMLNSNGNLSTTDVLNIASSI